MSSSTARSKGRLPPPGSAPACSRPRTKSGQGRSWNWAGREAVVRCEDPCHTHKSPKRSLSCSAAARVPGHSCRYQSAGASRSSGRLSLQAPGLRNPASETLPRVPQSVCAGAQAVTGAAEGQSTSGFGHESGRLFIAIQARLCRRSDRQEQARVEARRWCSSDLGSGASKSRESWHRTPTPDHVEAVVFGLEQRSRRMGCVSPSEP